MEKITEKQKNYLLVLGAKLEEIIDLSIKDASIMIAKLKRNLFKNENVETISKKSKITKNDVKIEKSVFDKSIFEKFKNENIKHWDKYDDKYYKYLLEIDGLCLRFEYPEIKTSFCFSYDEFRSESFGDACEMSEQARTNENYFIKENLKKLNEMLESLQSKDMILTTYKPYRFKDEMWNLNFVKKLGNQYYDNFNREITDNYKVVDADLKALLIKAVNEIKADFTKRLNTYLKKYGLKSVHSWTYSMWD